MFIIKNKKIFIAISLALVVLALVSLVIFGLDVGIDFKGGALSEVVYQGERPSQETLSEEVAKLDIGSVLIQPTGEKGYIIKTRELNEAEHAELLEIFSQNGEALLEETSFSSIGPSVGRELTRKAVIAIVLVSLAILCFIAFAFRKVSNPSALGHQGVASWRYGFIAIITLIHDIIIPLGVLAILSHYLGVELDALFVVAVLTILGLSISDTIVIFDRIRENLKKQAIATLEAKAPFSEVVGHSLEQTFVRSALTSLSTILVLVSLFFFGPISTKYFALILAVGMFVGTYSSIFLASSLLVWVKEWQDKK